MGILNVTPDSFSDGGKHLLKTQALIHARQMISDGASIIDVGGESTRPGATPISVDEELARVVPIVEALVQECDVCISVDTHKTPVMEAALAAGATMINDVYALRAEGAIACVARANATVCLMHMQGAPCAMPLSPHYENVVDEVKSFLADRIHACVTGGIAPKNIIIDPGFGFGKTLVHNVALLRHLSELRTLGYPIMVGLSRKSMIGALMNGAPVHRRLHGSLAAAVIALMQGASIVRVHDVEATVQTLALVDSVFPCTEVDAW
ncbi:dihydropteroate synthase [bacterium]|nr:dihydropteroate synthase [bacterium]